MGYKSSVKNWEGLAKNDAFWSILTDRSKKGDRWNLDDFFRSGKVEVDAIVSFLKENNISINEKGKALDFGCGAGRLSNALTKHFEKVVGVDASETMVKLARENNTDLSDRLEFIVNSEDSLKLVESGTISFGLTLIVLQHIPMPQSLGFIKELLRVLEKGGVAVFQVPVKDVRKISLWQKIKSSIRIKERLALIGIGSGFQMDMHVIPEEVIDEAVTKMEAEVVLKAFTNQTEPDYNGNLKFYSEVFDASGYVSRLFVVRKK